MSQQIMISCFDLTTTMAKPWAEAGFLCYCVDLQHQAGMTRECNIIKVGADMNDWLPPRGDIVFAAFFPPCYDVAVSGARWFKDKGIGALHKAIGLFDIAMRLAEWCEAPYLIENPISTISTYWRKPDHQFDPCDYGDPYTKRTCLWTGGGFVMPEKQSARLEVLPVLRQTDRGEGMKYVQYCYACKRQTEHVWIQISAPDKYRLHGRITDTVGWMECPECRKAQVYGKAEGREK